MECVGYFAEREAMIDVLLDHLLMFLLGLLTVGVPIAAYLFMEIAG